MCTTLSSYQILIRFESYAQIFDKYSNLIFHEYLSGGSRVVPCGQMDPQT